MESKNIEFNEDELQAPAWLNAQFIGGILSEYEQLPDLKVTDLQVSPATAQGDHYASIMFRTKVEYTTPKGKFSKPLIIKTMPEQEGHKKDMLAESHLFATEIGMYCHALPEFERILREAGDNTKLYVPCIYHSLMPRQVMVFEDLVAQGYTVIRDSPPSLGDLKLAFDKLAKWHAVSMKVINEQPDFLKELKHGMWGMTTFLNDPIVTTGIPCFLKMLDKVPELTKYKPYFEKIRNNYMQQMSKVMEEYRTDPKPNRYYVLCHGDFHARNMMFKNNQETGDFEDVMLVDFQISNTCPITIDLIYSIFMLMDSEERWDLGKEYINYYFSVLSETLRKIGFKGEMPTQTGIWEHIHSHKDYEFFMMTSMLPMMAAMKTNAFKMIDVLTDPETKQKTYFQDEYLTDVKKLLPKFEELGYFENL
uniref:GG11393 n=1 Tax=Drosophila erecta TaxID=7220 RepID=B3P6M3_DROER